MTFQAFAGAEAEQSAALQGSGFYTPVSPVTDIIIASPFDADPGNFAFQVDPVNGVLDTYGWQTRLTQPNFLTVMFRYRFEADFDAAIAVAELGAGFGAGTIARRLIQNSDEELGIVDETEDEIGTAAGALTADTDYWILWYVDLRVEAASRDIVWVHDGIGWTNIIDVSGHGDGDPSGISLLTFGSAVAKTVPTAGGPFYVKEMGTQFLNVSPNTTPIGSLVAKFKVPTGDGTDQDFDSGAPDWNDVKEIPPDGDTTRDTGDATGEKNSYEIADADGGDTPLAIQVIGSGGKTGNPGTQARTYILESGTRDFGVTYIAGSAYRELGAVRDSASGQPDKPKTFNQVNGKTITEVLFNGLQIGLELPLVASGGTFKLTQAGLEYMIDGPHAVPGDFPSATPRMVEVTGGAALASANVGVY
jgi:hypothetical protein